MKKYFKIYYLLFKQNLSARFAYRTNLFSSLIANLGWGIFSLIAIIILTTRVPDVAGWTQNELLLLVSLNAIFTGIFHLFFSPNFFRWAETIDRARLDNMLLLPIDSQFSISLWHSEPMSAFRVLLGIVCTGFLVFYMNLQITFYSSLLCIFLIIIANIIFYSLWFLMMTLLIWFTRMSNLVYFLDSLIQFTRYPKEMYRGMNIIFFFVLFPLISLGSTPTKALLHKNNTNEMLLFLTAAFILFLFSRLFWKFALRSYNSASS